VICSDYETSINKSDCLIKCRKLFRSLKQKNPIKIMKQKRTFKLQLTKSQRIQFSSRLRKEFKDKRK